MVGVKGLQKARRQLHKTQMKLAGKHVAEDAEQQNPCEELAEIEKEIEAGDASRSEDRDRLADACSYLKKQRESSSGLTEKEARATLKATQERLAENAAMYELKEEKSRRARRRR